LEIITRLMTGEPVSYQGKRVSLDGAQMRPLPVQRPHPPLWIGGGGPKRTLPIVARYADVWHAYSSPEGYRDMSARVSQLAAEAGRDPASILRAASLSLSESPDEIKRSIDGWRDLGVGYLICGWPGEGREFVERFATSVMGDYV
jgi:hypothetical protein